MHGRRPKVGPAFRRRCGRSRRPTPAPRHFRTDSTDRNSGASQRSEHIFGMATRPGCHRISEIGPLPRFGGQLHHVKARLPGIRARAGRAIGPEGERLRAIATLGLQSLHRQSNRLDQRHYGKPLRVKELADVAGIAVTTLHHHFRALTAMSPLQYQEQIRLQAGRARMLASCVRRAPPTTHQ